MYMQFNNDHAASGSTQCYYAYNVVTSMQGYQHVKTSYYVLEGATLNTSVCIIKANVSLHMPRKHNKEWRYSSTYVHGERAPPPPPPKFIIMKIKLTRFRWTERTARRRNKRNANKLFSRESEEEISRCEIDTEIRFRSPDYDCVSWILVQQRQFVNIFMNSL
jgi:hypothetical protein